MGGVSGTEVSLCYSVIVMQSDVRSFDIRPHRSQNFPTRADLKALIGNCPSIFSDFSRGPPFKGPEAVTFGRTPTRFFGRFNSQLCEDLPR